MLKNQPNKHKLSIGVTHYYLDSLLILRAGDIVLKDFPDVALTGQGLSPHLEQISLGGLALQVKQVVGLEVVEGSGPRVSPPAVGELVPLGGPQNVAVGPAPPEDRSDLLLHSVVIGCLLPWQWSLDLLTP